MTKAIKVGLRKQPYSSLEWHAMQIAELLKAPDIVPSMTDNVVRYEIGKQAVVEHLQEKSRIAPHEAFDKSFIIALCEHFPFPVFDWRSPIGDIMYCAGVKYALDAIVRYYNEQTGV